MNKIAVIIPCYNEELTIGNVISDFKKSLPDADIYVYDNNSSDRTAEIAKAAGAIVRSELRQGKGNVVRSMFRDVDADVYVMIDGDDTYPADEVNMLLEPVLTSGVDMVVGDRLSNGSYHSENSRNFHGFGNGLVRSIINFLFRSNLTDVMTGYRVFSRRFVKTMPVNSSGFEIETEMTLHALDKRFSIEQIPITYRDRMDGSESKLNTFSDGISVLKTILWVFKDYKPLIFFSIISLLFFVGSLVFGIPVISEYIETSFIKRVPSAILAVGLMLVSFGSLLGGFILDTVVKQHRESYELYLNGYDD